MTTETPKPDAQRDYTLVWEGNTTVSVLMGSVCVARIRDANELGIGRIRAMAQATVNSIKAERTARAAAS